MVQEEVKAMMNFVMIVVSSSSVSVISRDSSNNINTLLSLVKRRREGDGGVFVCDSGWLGKNSGLDSGGMVIVK